MKVRNNARIFSSAGPVHTINVTTMSPEEALKKLRHKDLVEETVPVGMMFASKAFVQLLANPIVGPLTHK